MKKIFNFLITICIFVLISLLCVSFCAKEIIINTLSKEIVRKEISSKVVDYAKEYYDDIDYDTLEKLETGIGNNENIDKITEKYFDNIAESITKDSEIKLPDTKDELLDLINQNEYILEENGIEITNEEKDKIVEKLTSDGKLDKIYENVVVNIKSDISNEEKNAIDLYNKITTNTFRWLVISIIVILVLIIALIKKSFYKWTYNLAISFGLSGVLITLLIPPVMDIISNDLTSGVLGSPLDININSLTNLGYICFALCAVLIIIYLIGNKITKYNSKKYDY